DVFEPNGSRAAAANLGVINKHQEIANLTLHSSADEDWFRFDLLTPADSTHKVRIEFLSSQINPSLELYGAGDSPLRSSATSGNFEEITLGGLQPGTYRIRVFGQLSVAANNPAYKLILDVPRALTPDIREANDSLATATRIGTLRNPT